MFIRMWNITHSYNLVVRGYNTTSSLLKFQNYIVISYKFKHESTPWSNISIPRYFPRK